MKTQKENINPLKQALGRSMGTGLPSNFNYRMMQEIRLEAEKKRKRRAFLVTLSLLAATLFLLSLGGYVLFSYLEWDIVEAFPQWGIQRPDSAAVSFYAYLGILVLLLLYLDYRLRNWQRNKSD